MSRWQKIAVGVFGVATTVLLAGPWVVEWYAARRAEAVLGQQQADDVGWEAVDWWWGSELSVHDIQIEGDGVEIGVERMTVAVDVNSALGGEVEIRDVTFEGIDARVDLAGSFVSQMRDVMSAGDSSETSGGGAAPGGGGLRRRLASLEQMTARDVRLSVGYAGRELVTVDGDGTWTRKSGVDSVSGAGTLGPGGLLAGESTDWQFEGAVRPGEPSADGELTFPEGLSVPFGPMQLQLDGVGGRVSRAAHGPEARATLLGLAVGTGDAEHAALAVEIPELGVIVEPAGRFRLETRAFSVETTPGRMGRVLAGAGESDSGDADSSGGATEGRWGWRRLASLVSARLDVSASGGAVEVHYRRDDEWRRLSLGRSVAFYKTGRRMGGRGQFGGGRVQAGAEWGPGQVIPNSVSVDADDVDLEEIPIIREGRNLPSKGVRGRIGGKVDLAGMVVDSGRASPLGRRIFGMFDFSWEDGWIEAGGLAGRPVRGIDLDLETGLEWAPELARYRLLDTEIRYGPVRVSTWGSLVDWPLAPHLELGMQVDEIACQEAVRSLPDALLGPYDDIQIDGKAAPRVEFELPFKTPKELKFELDGFPAECEVEALHTDPEGWPEVTFREDAEKKRREREFRDREQRELESLETFDLGGIGADEDESEGAEGTGDIELEAGGDRASLGVKTQPDPRPESERRKAEAELEPIPPNWSPRRPDDVFWLRKPFVMQLTEYVSEDAEVYVGPGVDGYVSLEAMPAYVAASAYLSEEIEFYTDGAWNTHLIRRGLGLNFSEDRFVYGGSTVTQQLVKNLFLTRDKTLARKIREALIAWRIQGVVSKDRVLELYLNCIEYGEDVYGIGPAAQYYFDKPAEELSILQAAFLAALKPAPWYGEDFLKRGETRETGWWPKRMRVIIERLHDKGFVTEAEVKAAKPYVVDFPEHRTEAAREKDEDW